MVKLRMSQWIRLGGWAIGLVGLLLAGCRERGRDGPQYLVVDLSGGPGAASYPVVELAARPPGGWTDEHKSTRMVFRRISPGIFMMGSPENEQGRYDHETQRQVRIKGAFYVGVFPVTQRHWYQVMGAWPSFFNHVSHRDARPVERVSFSRIRGMEKGARWPRTPEVDPDTFLGRLRSRTGLSFDLPTEAQWEYAARAGVTSALHSGKNLTANEVCPHLAALGRTWSGQMVRFSQDAAPEFGTALVGSYPPNAWGLYDMHGNVWEWCRDWYAPDGESGSNSGGPRSGTYRVLRGGSWVSIARHCRLAHRHSAPPGFAGSADGFRVVILP